MMMMQVMRPLTKAVKTQRPRQLSVSKLQEKGVLITAATAKTLGKLQGKEVSTTAKMLSKLQRKDVLTTATTAKTLRRGTKACQTIATVSDSIATIKSCMTRPCALLSFAGHLYITARNPQAAAGRS